MRKKTFSYTFPDSLSELDLDPVEESIGSLALLITFHSQQKTIPTAILLWQVTFIQSHCPEDDPRVYRPWLTLAMSQNGVLENKKRGSCVKGDCEKEDGGWYVLRG